MTRISLLALIPSGIFGHLGKQDDHILTPPSTGRDLFLYKSLIEGITVAHLL